MIPLLLFLSLLVSAKANNVCDPLMVEGCPIDEPKSRCARLQFNASQTAVCPHSLWTGYAQPIFNNFSSTASFTAAWRKIDGLTCSNGVWRVHRGQTVEEIHLESRVICAEKTPMIPLDAFRPLKGLSASDKLPNSPAYFCAPGDKIECGYRNWVGNEWDMNGYCVAYKDKEQKKVVKSCQCQFGFEGDLCSIWNDPYGYDFYPRSPKIVEATEEMEQDTCNILVAEGCPDEIADNCIKLRYFNGEIYCPRKLWRSTGDYTWKRVSRVRCDKNQHPNWWMITDATSKKELELTRRVQCSDNMPISNTSKMFTPQKQEIIDYEEAAVEERKYNLLNGIIPNHKFERTWMQYCHYNGGYCHNKGYCVLFHGGMNPFAISCHCTVGYLGATCMDPYDPDVFAAPQHERNGTTKTEEPTQAMCDVEDLIDACATTDKYCHRLKANHSRVKCPAKLWLNFGSDLMPDWHEISAVVCVDNDWRSECSKEIEKRPLMCSKEKPSAISTSMWFTLGGAIVAIIFIVGITCIMCLLCRKRRQMKKLVSRANQQTETSCDPSSKCRTEDMSDATVTERTEKSQ